MERAPFWLPDSIPGLALLSHISDRIPERQEVLQAVLQLDDALSSFDFPGSQLLFFIFALVLGLHIPLIIFYYHPTPHSTTQHWAGAMGILEYVYKRDWRSESEWMRGFWDFRISNFYGGPRFFFTFFLEYLVKVFISDT